MANEAYIYRIRTDIGAGAMQITDLLPNTSRRAFSYQSYGQSGYCPARVTADNVTTAANPTTVAYSGLEAYLLDVTNDEFSGNQISAANAHSASTAIIALADAGSPIDTTALASIFATLGMGANTLPYPSNGMGAASVGTRADLMKVICGGDYTLPVGSTVNPAAPTTQEGSFDDDSWRQLYQSGSMSLSAGQGDIATFSDATFTYASVAGAALVAYKLDGTVL